MDTERGWRGGQRQTLWLARALRAQGHGTLLAARSGQPLADRAVAEGLNVWPLRPFVEGDPLAVWSLRRAMRRANATIVHAHSGHAVALGALATLGTAARLVVTRRVDFRLNDNAFTRWKYRRASAVIAISDAVGAALRASGVAPDRITVIPSGVDLDRRVDAASSATLAALGVPPGAPVVVQVSALVGHKDPLTFVRAVAVAHRRVPALRALLVGDGHLRGEVTAAVRELDLEDVLRVTGYRADADALIAAANVVTLSSREEGLGTVLLDAMAFGGAVAATAAGGIPEIVRDDVTGLLAPIGDGAALGDRIARLASDPALAARLAAAARGRVRAFSVEATAEQTLGVYRRVALPQG